VKRQLFHRDQSVVEKHAGAPERQQAVTAEMLCSMATKEIVPPVEAEYRLVDVLAAVEHSERPGRNGKVLLVG